MYAVELAIHVGLVCAVAAVAARCMPEAERAARPFLTAVVAALAVGARVTYTESAGPDFYTYDEGGAERTDWSAVLRHWLLFSAVFAPLVGPLGVSARATAAHALRHLRGATRAGRT